MSRCYRSIGQRAGVCCNHPNNYRKTQVVKLITPATNFCWPKPSREPLRLVSEDSPPQNSLFGRAESFYCYSHDVNIHRGGCTLLTRLGVVSSRQGCFYISHINGAHWAVTHHLNLDLGCKLSGLQPMPHKVKSETDWVTFLMKSRLRHMTTAV